MAATLPASHYNNDKMERTEPLNRPPTRRRPAPWADKLFSLLAHAAAVLTLALLAAFASIAFYKGAPGHSPDDSGADE